MTGYYADKKWKLWVYVILAVCVMYPLALLLAFLDAALHAGFAAVATEFQYIKDDIEMWKKGL